MTSASWHARISCGRDTGAGFLVTERHVLTCAHVVARSRTDTVTVSFAHGTEGQVPARVVAQGGWDGRETDPGDLAVLELGRPVPMRPAEFAAPSDAYGDPPRRLLAYGFPKRSEEGTLAEYRATADQLIAGEWVQLEAWAAHGQPLVPGFSGAAVTLADTGRVVGMVSAAARDPAVRNGRMLPAQVMARYWPRLGELIPTPGYGREDKERLLQLIEAVSGGKGSVGGEGGAGSLECRPDGLYLDAVGPLGPPLPPHGFGSLWDAAWYLLSEVPDTAAVTRFSARLADFVEDARLRAALRSWPSRAGDEGPGGTNPVRRSAAPAWSPILVEIADSGSGDGRFMVEVSVYNGRHRRLVGSRTLPVERVRPYALERIDEAYRELEPDARELIAFVLPRRRLNTDVAGWQRSADDDSPLGSFAPVVVLDLERRRSGALQHKLVQKWRHLDARSAARLHRIGCSATGQNPVRLTVGLRQGAVDMVGFGTPPRVNGTLRLFGASLNAAVPVLLWPRSGCRGGPSHEDCRGAEFLDRLAEHLTDLPPVELPSYIHELREEAHASDAPERHWAHDLALLWEDPRCLPDPDGYRHSPVG
ncbi:VMAP-C domain-containing protein [Streptomyces ureilyticus]|uniref:Trypsin-like peptidase domain-containing protein n=1 Tax=Streptomyces ureilyticus TaxID=1775131 RepID=A0ABX0E6X1_9ACTN|nr:trypsin-like peptidase domain-containing protein [Streptomyces ureilyticus]NGO49290.1 trypsin-like peptidase domain-containing protein [Streptomyces ureilyticus]